MRLKGVVTGYIKKPWLCGKKATGPRGESNSTKKEEKEVSGAGWKPLKYGLVCEEESVYGREIG